MTKHQSKEFILDELEFREPVKFSYEFVYRAVQGRVPDFRICDGIVHINGRRLKEVGHDPAQQVVFMKRLRDGKPWPLYRKPGSIPKFDVESASRVTLAREEVHLRKVCSTSPVALLPMWRRLLEEAG